MARGKEKRERDEARKAIKQKINQQKERGSERQRVKCRESKILKKDTARQRRIKRESSDDCDIDDSTVGKKG